MKKLYAKKIREKSMENRKKIIWCNTYRYIKGVVRGIEYNANYGGTECQFFIYNTKYTWDGKPTRNDLLLEKIWTNLLEKKLTERGFKVKRVEKKYREWFSAWTKVTYTVGW